MNTPVLSWLLSYLFNALWQIPLLFVAAWVVTRIARRTGPRAEHRIWVGALLLQLALPACNLRIVAVWRALHSLLPASGNAGIGGVQVFLGPATIRAGALRLPFAFEAGILIAWACVTLYFAARLAWGLIETRRLARAATPLALGGEAAERWTRHCDRFGIIAPPPQIAVSSQAAGLLPSGCAAVSCSCRRTSLIPSLRTISMLSSLTSSPTLRGTTSRRTSSTRCCRCPSPGIRSCGAHTSAWQKAVSCSATMPPRKPLPGAGNTRNHCCD